MIEACIFFFFPPTPQTTKINTCCSQPPLFTGILRWTANNSCGVKLYPSSLSHFHTSHFHTFTHHTFTHHTFTHHTFTRLLYVIPIACINLSLLFLYNPPSILLIFNYIHFSLYKFPSVFFYTTLLVSCLYSITYILACINFISHFYTTILVSSLYSITYIVACIFF